MATALKKVFISDIHMGDARSFAGPHPYGWLRRNIPTLAAFLHEQADSKEVSEVIILGDLFDTWVIPVDQPPLTSFLDIYQNDKNAPVIEGLQTLAERGKLTYVPGNHDMIWSGQEQDTTQEFMEAHFRGIRYEADPALPHGVYRRGTIVAEHGNRYGLFNAADTWTSASSFLPLGYFISRVYAYKVAQTGAKKDFHHILRWFVLESIIDEAEFIHDLFLSLAHDAGLKGTDTVQMGGIPGFPESVEGIGSLYDPLIKQWQENRKDLNWRLAVAGDIGQLLLAAAVVYFSRGLDQQNIVIFGHTHKAEVWKNYQFPIPGFNWFTDRLIRYLLIPYLKKLDLLRELGIPKLQLPDYLKTAPMVRDIHLNLPCRSIYANSGTWVDGAGQCTYVETQENYSAGRHYVRLRTYPDQKLLHEEYVKLS